MKKSTLIYYVITALFSVFILMGVYAELSGDPASQAAMAGLGYPPYFNTILGWAKILGLIAIWQPFLPTLREWAYAGFFFDFVGAIISILAVSGAFKDTGPVWISLILWLISYFIFRKQKPAHPSEIVRVKA